MLIGGGLSLVFTAIVLLAPHNYAIASAGMLPYFILLSNSAHFAASTVRLYTKPGAYTSLPFLTMAFPLVSIAVLTLCIFQAARLGPHFQALYLTWSPYHYAAQAYGLAVMYSYRSGCVLSPINKTLLWWVSMLPFFYNFLGLQNAGLGWIVPAELLTLPPVNSTLRWLRLALILLASVMPAALFIKVWRAKSGPMPLLSMLMVITNGIWWLVLEPVGAFVWATIFHGVQYLAITVIFHLKDQMARADNRHGRLYHVLWFYGVSLLLGYGLFNSLPLAYVFAGFGMVESMFLVVAAINIHHFIVDGFIWRLKKSDSNRRIVDSGQVSLA
jgi:hypothetical protein